jgi:hypothetical protein
MHRSLQFIRIATAFLLFISLCSCSQKSLFPKNQQRNQFEAYNTMRYGPQITEQPDLFGLPETALRERLGKKNK